MGRTLNSSLDSINSRLDSITAVTNACLLATAKEQVPCPRLVIFEPDTDSQASPASTCTPSPFAHFRREMMDTLLGTMQQSPPVRLRVRFLCAHDLSAAKCGEDGRGYKLEIEQWHEWLRQCLPIFQVSFCCGRKRDSTPVHRERKQLLLYASRFDYSVLDDNVDRRNRGHPTCLTFPRCPATSHLHPPHATMSHTDPPADHAIGVL